MKGSKTFWIPDDLSEKINELVVDGKFASASHFVREAIKKLLRVEGKL